MVPSLLHFETEVWNKQYSVRYMHYKLYFGTEAKLTKLTWEMLLRTGFLSILP